MRLNLAEDDAVYVGVIPATLGMLFLPFLRRVGERWIRFFMAVTIGLLGFLAVDAYLEGTRDRRIRNRSLRRRRAGASAFHGVRLRAAHTTEGLAIGRAV